jgi:hypothetical protein
MIETVPALPPSGWRFNTLKTDSDRDLIADWLKKDVAIGDSKAVREYMLVTLRGLRFLKMELWKEPQFKWFRGAHEGIGEVRLYVRRVEYRLLGCLGPNPDEFTLLVGATKRSNSEWKPPNARDSAVSWKDYLNNHPENINAINL